MPYRSVVPVLFAASVFILSCTFYGCQKSDSSGPYLYRLKSYTSNVGDSSHNHYSFSYDAKNHLEKITDNSYPSNALETKIFYNSNDKPNKSYRYRINTAMVEFSSDTLIYNSSLGLTAKYYTFDYRMTEKHSYSHDSQGRISGDSSFSVYNGVWVLSSFNKYLYDTNSNVVKHEMYYINFNLGKLDLLLTSNIIYNNDENFFDPAIRILNTDYLNLSRNNIKEVNLLYSNGWGTGSSTDTYDYEYYENGLPKKLVITHTNGIPNGYGVDKMEFFYEKIPG
jgi:hypothetical protein